MKIKLFLLLVCVSLYFNNSKIYSQSPNIQVFALLDLNYKGLENVKQLHLAGNDTEALKALLTNYRERETVVNPAFKEDNTSISPEQKKMAEDAMQHTFFSYNGFKPFNYGKDIDWTYWPVRDNELRWQLHRQKWFIPMGKMFYINGDEKYAKEWTFQYQDWIKKNPLIPQPKKELSTEEQLIEDNKVDDNNMRYAWRPMEVSHRLSEQYTIFQLFRNSNSFTPEFLAEFLWNTHRHADFVLNHYSKGGNHLLFEAQRMLFAGVYFPEFKDAAMWRKSGSEILVREMPKQIYPDGFQFELDPGYHSGCIGIFLSALRVAEVNGYADIFPSWYRQTISGMIQAYYNILLPDFSCPMFSDMSRKVKSDAMKSFKDWKTSFPEDKALQYFISGGKSGEAPEYTSRAFKTSGFYIFRSDWTENATAMVLKAGPQAGWHAQPDNGTFNIMFKGRNFFPDAGSYSYGGDAEITRMRESFKQTKVHNTITLDNRNLEVTNSKCLLWKTGNDTEILVVENPSYKGLTHRRSVFFVDKKFFVIVDEAVGEANGNVGLHFNFCEGPVQMDASSNEAVTGFEDGNNILLKTFCDHNQKMLEQEGWISYKAKEKFPRKAFSFDVEKKDTKAVRYITIIMPYNPLNQLPKVNASFDSNEFNDNSLKLSVTINGKKTNLTYQLEK